MNVQTAELTNTTASGFILPMASIHIYKHKWGGLHDMLDEIKQHHRAAFLFRVIIQPHLKDCH